MKHQTIFVTGAGGHVGSAAVKELTDKGYRVRALTRTAHSLKLPSGATEIVGDLANVDSLQSGLDGADGLFLMAGYVDDKELLKRAKAAGVNHVVLLSAGPADGGSKQNAVTKFDLDSEEAVRASGLAWTILRPSGYMSNALRRLPEMQHGNILHAQFPDAAITLIDPADIGAVAAAALIDPEKHRGKIYRLTGPEALRPAEEIAILAEVLKRPLVCIGLTDEQTEQELKATLPPQYVHAMMDFFSHATASYNDSIVNHTVADVLGRKPHTFRSWVVAHAKEFALA